MALGSVVTSFSRSLQQFFLTVGQNNFGNKIPTIDLYFISFILLFLLNLIGIFASGGSDGSIMFWSVGADKEVGAIEAAHESIVWALSWHPAGHILCSGKLQIRLIYPSL